MPSECKSMVKGFWKPDPNEPEGRKWVELRTAFSCSIPVPDGYDSHEGPHAAREQQATMIARANWEKENEEKQRKLAHQASGLNQFQDVPKKFSDIADPGTSLPHPSAPTKCPLCPEEPMHKDLAKHLAAHAYDNVAPQVVEQPQRHISPVNPYMRDDGYDPAVAPPARRIAPTRPEAPGWNLPAPQNPPPAVTGVMDALIHTQPRPETYPTAEEIVEAYLGQIPTHIQGSGAEALYPTKTREGDQVLPTHNEHKPIQDIVIEEIENRKQIGLERYGSLLQPDNGRDSLRDAKEEALDLLMYLTQQEQERKLRAEDFKVISGFISRITKPLSHIGHEMSEDELEALRRLESWLNPPAVG